MLWKKSGLTPHLVHQIRAMVACQKPHTTQGGQAPRTALHPPMIQVRPSSITGAGSGVFASQPIPMDTLVTLYPGIYTPPLPAFTAGTDDEYLYYYLADRTTPSGLAPEVNPYILNLTAVGGGYLDGLITTGDTATARTTTTTVEPTTDPTAMPCCGHLINHDSSKPNINVVSFVWNDVLQLESNDDDENRWNTELIPNRRRSDGSPWYYDGREERVVHFASQPPSSTLRTPHEGIVCGAAMVSIKDIETHQELLLDYGLHPPYPSWARDWYPG